MLLTGIAMAESGAAVRIIDCGGYCAMSESISQSTEISSSSRVFANPIGITGPMVLTNYGTLSGTIDVSPGVEIAVRNLGTMSAVFNLGANARLSQYISSPAEMTRLSVSGGVYAPVIRRDFDGSISAAGLLGFGVPVKDEKSFLDITASMEDLQALAERLRITGSGSLRLTISGYSGGDLALPNFDGLVFVDLPEADPMFVYEATPGGLVKVRQKDYAAIFGRGDARAAMLNGLRDRDPGNRVLGFLDGAPTEPDLLRAMSETMFFNPPVLNRGIVRMMARPDFGAGAGAGMGFYAGARPVLDGGNIGNHIDAGYIGKDGLSARVGIYAGAAAEDDDRKYGRAAVFGASAGAEYDAFAAGVKMMRASWSDALVLSRGAAKTDPAGAMYYGNIDFAPKIGYFRPIVRLNYFMSEIEEFSESGFYAGYGARAAFSENMMGVGNIYSAYAMLGGPFGFDCGIAADWDFAEDGAAVGVRAGPDNFRIEARAGF